MKKNIAFILLGLILITGCKAEKSDDTKKEESEILTTAQNNTIIETETTEDEKLVESIAGLWVFIAPDIYGEYNERCVNRDYYLRIEVDGRTLMKIEGQTIHGEIKEGAYDWVLYYGNTGKFNIGKINALDPFLDGCLDVSIPVQDITVATFKNIKELE